MPRIPTISRAALLKMQAKSPPEKLAQTAAKAGAPKTKAKKKPAPKR
jgi:hypothetical protein